MNKEIIENFFISNGNELSISQFDEVVTAKPSIYEVIRVIEGVPLFLEDHMERLVRSAASLDSSLKNITPNIVIDIKKLIRLNNYPEKNIKLIVYNLAKAVPDYLIYFITSNYPAAESYADGIHTILVDAERTNPNAKIINNELRELVNQKLMESNAYEALLVNNRGEITEGSRSNLFFVEQGKIYTAPAEDVLIGITRKYILASCNNLGLQVVEQPIPFSMLDYADGAFITGTSPKLLPIASIDERQIDSVKNPIVCSILNEYEKLLSQYIKEHK